ncbi:4Fe-4S ferredoxin [Desulfovibrio sp.]|uniref:4Fe-4S ferredoxin n=1 Tax=Desulfovibrio sp. TaxID=885 RepID=UPI0025BC688D|nr:4Fe-4S ferredoxin [Desulfovibrio sp.]
MSNSLHTVFFSPTHSSKQIVRAMAATVAPIVGKSVIEHDLTLPDARGKKLSCAVDDALLLAFPVYAGRIPRPLLDSLAGLMGNGAVAVPVAVYGNRHYDDALLEAVDILLKQGFAVPAAAAFVAEHSLTPTVGSGRPDVRDMAAVLDFSKAVAAAVLSACGNTVTVPGKRPYRDLPPAVDLRPKTSQSCTQCMICAANCPMQVISFDDAAEISHGCIRCCACVKSCPEGAKYFDQEPVLNIVDMLEKNCLSRREPEVFVAEA